MELSPQIPYPPILFMFLFFLIFELVSYIINETERVFMVETAFLSGKMDLRPVPTTWLGDIGGSSRRVTALKAGYRIDRGQVSFLILEENRDCK